MRMTHALPERRTILGALGAAALGACATTPPSASPRPIVIAHRGASGERPEHTLAAYRLAIAQGADFIEPDLVLTRDGVLVCRHENEISGTTDVGVRPEFAARRRRKGVDFETVEGWFTEDFTLAELKTLKARERLPELRPESARHDGEETIPTFEEVLALAAAEGEARGRPVGVYPETKHPSHFEALGLSFDAPLVAALQGAGLDRPDAPVFIQSFETGNLKRLAGLTRAPLIQLVAAEGMPFDHLHTSVGITYAEMLREGGLRQISRYAAGIGVQKNLLLPRDGEGRTTEPTDLVSRAHAAGLKVHAWTFRNENTFLPLELRRGDASAPDYPRIHGDAAAEIVQAAALGIDGLFTDFPGTAMVALAGAQA